MQDDQRRQYDEINDPGQYSAQTGAAGDVSDANDVTPLGDTNTQEARRAAAQHAESSGEEVGGPGYSGATTNPQGYLPGGVDTAGAAGYPGGIGSGANTGTGVTAGYGGTTGTGGTAGSPGIGGSAGGDYGAGPTTDAGTYGAVTGSERNANANPVPGPGGNPRPPSASASPNPDTIPGYDANDDPGRGFLPGERGDLSDSPPGMD